MDSIQSIASLERSRNCRERMGVKSRIMNYFRSCPNLSQEEKPEDVPKNFDRNTVKSRIAMSYSSVRNRKINLDVRIFKRDGNTETLKNSRKAGMYAADPGTVPSPCYPHADAHSQVSEASSTDTGSSDTSFLHSNRYMTQVVTARDVPTRKKRAWRARSSDAPDQHTELPLSTRMKNFFRGNAVTPLQDATQSSSSEKLTRYMKLVQADIKLLRGDRDDNFQIIIPQEYHTTKQKIRYLRMQLKVMQHMKNSIRKARVTVVINTRQKIPYRGETHVCNTRSWVSPACKPQSAGTCKYPQEPPNIYGV